MYLLLSFGSQVVMTLYKVFDWLELTIIGSTIRDSVWLFPVIESFHLIGLAILGGSVLIVDLRLLGLGLNQLSIKSVAQTCRPWFIFSLLLMFTTGIPLFLSEAIKCYYNPFFWIKMGTLLFALVLTFTLRKKLALNRKMDWVLLKYQSNLTLLIANSAGWCLF